MCVCVCATAALADIIADSSLGQATGTHGYIIADLSFGRSLAATVIGASLQCILAHPTEQLHHKKH